MISIANRYKHKAKAGDVYCGRPTALGNPFNEGTRDENCDAYEEWFLEQVKSKENAQFMAQLREIYVNAKHGDIALICYCAPKRCHTETIKRFIDGYL